METLDLERCYRDFFYFAANCLWVQEYQTLRIVPLRLKPVQVRLAEAICADLAAGRPARYIVLKARREGVSTLVQALFMWRAVTRKYQSGMTLSHHDQTTGELFGMSERYYRRLPKRIRPTGGRVRTGTVLEFANRKENAASRGMESVLRTVTFKNAGAGQAANLLHCSEVGLWGNEAETTLATLFPVVPNSSDSIIVLESTARGVGNTFHDQWLKAERGESAFTPFFIPWYEEPGYTLPEKAGDLGELDDEEAVLRDLGVSDDQLAWRRWVGIPNQPSLDSFHQEYPSTPEEAFLASGRPFFDQKLVAERRREAQQVEAGWTGNLLEEEGKIIPQPSRKGSLKVWEMPTPDEDYLIACDPSAGLDQGDPQAAVVYKRSSLECVAAWHGHTDNSELGNILYRLGKVYNTALIAVELNAGWGEAVIGELRRRYYPRLYRKVDKNKAQARRERKYGWLTTINSRALVLEALRDAVRHEELVCHDADFWHECHTFVIDENEKPRAEAGAHDDRVMAHAIACHLWTTTPKNVQHEYVGLIQKPLYRPRSTVTNY